MLICNIRGWGEGENHVAKKLAVGARVSWLFSSHKKELKKGFSLKKKYFGGKEWAGPPRKATRPSGSVDSSNPHCWRGDRLHHHGGDVCCVFVLCVAISSGRCHLLYVK